jgi:hypothetical protein
MPSNADPVTQMNLTLLLPVIVSNMAENADLPKSVPLESTRSARNRSEAEPQRQPHTYKHQLCPWQKRSFSNANEESRSDLAPKGSSISRPARLRVFKRRRNPAVETQLRTSISINIA